MIESLLPGGAALPLAGPAAAITITPTNDPAALVGAIVGEGVTIVGTPTLTAADGQAGLITGGGAELGFPAGIGLSTGGLADAAGPSGDTDLPETRGVGNSTGDDLSVPLGGAGSPLIADSFDAATLGFPFQFGGGSVGGEVNLGLVLASEEYVDCIDPVFDDEFQLLIDGVNVGLAGGVPVNVDNVNDVENAAFSVNDVADTDGIPGAGRAIAFDGLTVPLAAGTDTATFVVAEVADPILDAGVLIQGGTFSPAPPPPPVVVPPGPAVIPLPAALPALLGLLRRRG